jgi:hypothetical protein
MALQLASLALFAGGHHAGAGHGFLSFAQTPRGEVRPATKARLSAALVRMGRWVRED